MHQAKVAYSAPRLKEWGNVAKVTQNGCTDNSGDTMNGSVTWSNGRPKAVCPS